MSALKIGRNAYFTSLPGVPMPCNKSFSALYHFVSLHFSLLAILRPLILELWLYQFSGSQKGGITFYSLGDKPLFSVQAFS
jgi:hypothetical protein